MSKQEHTCKLPSRRSGLAITLTVAALTASAAAVAGPFCSNGPRYSGPAMNPHSPMGMAPHNAYGSPQGYMAPQRGMANMPAQGGYQMPAYTANPRGYPYPGAYANPGYAQQAAPAVTQTQAASDSAQTAQDGKSVTVRINGMRFEPSNITIEPGTTVTWIHNGNMPHTVSGTDGLQSKTMYQGQRFSHTFDEAGSFDYICDFHPSMKGSVVVKDGGTRT